jgi:hypothetical protein
MQPPMPSMQPPGRPGTITAAGILWIIYGSLGLLGSLLTLRAAAGPMMFVQLFVAIAFLSGGIQAVTGRVSTLLATGIVSIIWGVMNLLAIFALSALVRGLHAEVALLSAVGLFLGGMLITAGILACVGNAKFKAWRQYRGR